MKIGILGTGNVGANLGRRFSAVGHSILFGTRNPHNDLVADLVRDTLGGAGSYSEAVEYGEVVVLALPWSVAEDLLPAFEMNGKIVIDAMNAVAWENGPVPGVEESVGEMIAAVQPHAKVVKAFNAIGAESLMDPTFRGYHADAYICGNDEEAKKTVMDLAESIGFNAVDAGPLRNAKLVENLAILWIHLSTLGGLGRDTAFKLIER